MKIYIGVPGKPSSDVKKSIKVNFMEQLKKYYGVFSFDDVLFFDENNEVSVYVMDNARFSGFDKDIVNTNYAAPWTLEQYSYNIKHFYITNTSNVSFGNAYKDLEEAMYYHTIRESMEETKDERKIDKQYGRMYYYEPTKYTETRPFPEMRDSREGVSPMSRRMYMESKEMHQDKNYQLKELENYMKELSSDITEMIADASPEEKQLLKQKMTTLMSKIV